MWYLRKSGKVKGPYPAGLISRYILLGRVNDGDEVSRDGEEWIVIRDIPELIPDVMKGDVSDPLVQERLKAARRWADERGVDRRGEREGDDHSRQNRRGSDRREEEQSPVIEHRYRRAEREQEPFADSQGRWTMLMITGTIAVVAGIFLLFYKPPPPQLGADCNSPATPNVNWSNCVLDGARLGGLNLSGAMLYSASLTAADLHKVRLEHGNLSYAALSIANLEDADLREAVMTGANLRQAKLNNAHLDNADLSYVDLTGADLSGVRMHNTKLGNAIWTDGSRCLPGSVDKCLSARQ